VVLETRAAPLALAVTEKTISPL